MSLFTGEAPPGRAYWWEGVEWPETESDSPDKVDLLIVGAGYTGLSAAIAAHDAGAKVAVVDAGWPGQGASSRNGGMVGAHPRLGWEALEKAFGRDTADALFAEAAPALEWVTSLIEREAIDCDFRQTGRVQLAYTHTHLAGQKRLAGHVTAKSDVACQLLSRDDLAKEIATPLYLGGLLFPQHCALHPAKYHKGLLEAVLRRSVPVISECPVLGIERDGGKYRADTPKGSIRADKVLLATNGYTSPAFGWFAARVFPVPSYLIATEELPSDVIARLAPGGRMMVETRATHSYFRVSPDGSRLIFGGRAALVNLPLETAARRLRETMAQIWPEVRDIRLSHVWTGNTGYTFGHLPHVGSHDGVHYAIGFSGSGTVMAPYLGAKAALQALSAPGGETAYADTSLRSRWFFRGGRPLFLYPADFWYRHWVDRREARAAMHG